MIGEICKSPHINYMLDFKKKIKCNVYVEIGVLYGGSIIAQMKDPQECLFIGIDPFNGYYGKEYDCHRNINLKDHIQIVEKNINENNPHNHNYKLLKGYSQDITEDFRSLDVKIDLLFIDGDHSKMGVMNDFNNYFEFVNKDGYIIFDNYNDSSWEQVKIAVDEITESNTNIKIVDKVGHCCVVQKLID
jgi:hypothetical protein